jgi:hypothetical protein
MQMLLLRQFNGRGSLAITRRGATLISSYTTAVHDRAAGSRIFVGDLFVSRATLDYRAEQSGPYFLIQVR